MIAHIRLMAAADLDAVIALAESTPGAPHWPRGEYSNIFPTHSQIGKSGMTDNPAPISSPAVADVPAKGNVPIHAPVRATAFVALPGNQLTDDQLIGFAIARLILDIGQLESIVVDPAFRRHGIGGALLKAVLNWAREHGAQRIELEVRESNAAAIALYKANGFEQEGVRRSYYSAPAEDALLMSLPLDNL